ncbi:cyclic lactone autoinducer peptide [Lachnospiraceae bacterium ZAX-1]
MFDYQPKVPKSLKKQR